MHTHSLRFCHPGHLATFAPLRELDARSVTLFAFGGVPQHAAGQLPSGRQTSKLGPSEDIEQALDHLTGMAYGSVVLIMNRPLPAGGQKAGREGTQPP